MVPDGRLQVRILSLVLHFDDFALIDVAGHIVRIFVREHDGRPLCHGLLEVDRGRELL